MSNYSKNSVLDRNLALSGIDCVDFTKIDTITHSCEMQAMFDVFLFVLTLFNAASRPRRANVKIITDLRRDGCVFYLVRENRRLSTQQR